MKIQSVSRNGLIMALMVVVLILGTSLEAILAQPAATDSEETVEITRSPIESTPTPLAESLEGTDGTSEGDVVFPEDPLFNPGLEPLADGNEIVNPMVVTKYYYVPGSVLQSRGSGSGYAYDGVGCIHRISGTDNFTTELDLPPNATIKYLRLFFYDTSTSNMTAWVTRYGGGTIPTHQDLVSVASGGTAGYGTTLSGQISHVVNTYNWAYTLVWNPGLSSTSLRLCGLRVMYQE